jgi:hypothetical protein
VSHGLTPQNEATREATERSSNRRMTAQLTAKREKSAGG